ncbi:hypothetical protein CEUSTIGMA_g9408.t1 [Chlamydomonas eustigma]|uniref:Uncharacterized protein n=1 Tax=Chlamydomonas eustigma TaxID=1157962 RepID=A0A250XGR2_9CHLO|nr:hypothetical protein CEUSTIGMA_g9408.t1 [Chlamydomonas eustigma]|eukprot:GAX81980.1 hypothetical protein CEUSTIGMA_g9408.t1 [Chlamydomonas eustigma]
MPKARRVWRTWLGQHYSGKANTQAMSSVMRKLRFGIPIFEGNYCKYRKAIFRSVQRTKQESWIRKLRPSFCSKNKGIAKEAEESATDTLQYYYEAEQAEISRAEALRLAGLSAAERKAAHDADAERTWALTMQAMANVRDKGKAHDEENVDIHLAYILL